jgi:hypothetical protein
MPSRELSVPARLLGFAAVLVLVFWGAVAAGSALGPDRDGSRATSSPGHAGVTEGPSDGGEDGAVDPVRGLAVGDDRFTLRLDRPTVRPGWRTTLAFRIVDRAGRTVRDFDVEHTRRMHLIVVRRDLGAFQHLHPVQGADGRWTVPLTLPEAGTYRVMADFSVDDRPHTLATDLTADGTVRTVPLPPPASSAEADGLQVRLAAGTIRAGEEAALRFTATRDGHPVALQPYLGAAGHLVALREGDLAFLHVHPDADALNFMTTFPSAGRYRLFLQVRAAGQVHTAAFTVEVTR